MPQPLDSRRSVRRDLALNQREFFFSNLTIGTGETFLPAFTLAMGFGQINSGYISALPFMIASIVQLATPWILSRVGSYRKWVILLALAQGLCFIPLLSGASHGSMSVVTLFSVVTLYWVFGLASASAWNSWICALVPSSLRPKYFASRGRLGQLGLLVALVGAGYFLEYLKPHGLELKAFAALFLCAALFRLGSAFCFAKQNEPQICPKKNTLPWKETLERVKKTDAGRLLLTFGFFQMAVHICSPFLNPFMLSHLKLSYTAYMGLVATPYLAKIALFPYVAEWGRRVGSYRMLQISALAAVVRPAFWMVSDSYSWLVFAQLYDGAVFAVFDLALTLALFETVGNQERTRVMSLYNLTNAAAIMIGTVIGAQVLKTLGATHSTYMILFGASVLARFVGALAIEKAMLRIKTSQLWPARTLAKPLRAYKRMRDEAARGTHAS